MKTSNMKTHLIFAGVVIGLLLYCWSIGVMGDVTGGVKPDMQEADACPSNPAQLLPCLSAVTGSGSKPSSSCCSVLNDWGFDCLCAFLTNNQALIPGKINVTRIMEIPEACGITVPGGAKCGLPAESTQPSGGRLYDDMP
ncbi:hypothetical protein R1flu_017556 [Riccia fluitans]|uniref:Bifunctional inhibitor/plant lipid transfer protein/seed storage helical domain-containing protein n=1 Tax=Riccia fluitans TaxID=41844 RepID=A0ABD1ZDL0_9MARC